uniref:Uncharacterized protein n=1 Tax=Daphnia magna TaxID=35525 RepID=A0A0P6EVU4_9CRUS
MGLTIIGRRSNQLDKSHLKKVVGPSRVHSRLTPVDNRKNHFLDSVKFHLYSIDVDPSAQTNNKNLVWSLSHHSTKTQPKQLSSCRMLLLSSTNCLNAKLLALLTE